MNRFIKTLISGTVIFALAGCLFDGETPVAGGEDFPNTITPLGKVTANNIDAATKWDQFQSMDTIPDLSTDSLANTLILAKSNAAKVMAVESDFKEDIVVTLQSRDTNGITTLRRYNVDVGPDGQLTGTADNVLEEFEVLHTRNGDTLDWTQLRDADSDGKLWGHWDFGLVELTHYVKNPSGRPTVANVYSTLKAWIFQHGKFYVPLAFDEQCILTNGDTTVVSIKGNHGPESFLMARDTSLVTIQRKPFKKDSLVDSKGLFWVRLGALERPFTDNALLRYEIKNRYAVGPIRYDSLAFTADTAIASGNPDIHGNFVLLATDGTGAVQSNVTGSFRNDSIETNLHEIRDGVAKDYHMVFDKKGEVTEKERR